MRLNIYKNYLLTLLTLILLFNFVDRLALGIALQNIKTEFDLNDSQLGLLSGIAFALFYSVMGIPIARWADRGNRVAIISLTAALWSLAVVMCGAAKSFVQLLLIRVNVAVGEAGCVPPAFSLLADNFSRAERPRATAIYQSAGVLCAIPGYWLAGWLNELYGWRVMFVVLGLPGLALAIVAWLTLKEPRAQLAESQASVADSVAQPSIREVAKTLAASRTFRELLLCMAVLVFCLYGLGQWHAPFYERTHGLTSSQIGTWLTVVYCAGGLIGTYLGGQVPTRYAAHNERLQLVGIAIGLVCSGALMASVYLAPNAAAAFTLQGLSAIGVTACNGPVLGTIQTLVPERMRAMAIALVFFFANLIGAGLGPLVAGALSDMLTQKFSNDSLRYALLALTPGFLWAAWHALRASRTVTQEINEATQPSFEANAA